MEYTIDQAESFELIPVGAYQVVVKDVQPAMNATKDLIGLDFTYKIFDGDQKGRELTERLWIASGNAEYQKSTDCKVAQFLKAAGFLVKGKTDKCELPTGKAAFKNKKLWIEIKHSNPDKDGNVWARVKKFLAPDNVPKNADFDAKPGSGVEKPASNW